MNTLTHSRHILPILVVGMLLSLSAVPGPDKLQQKGSEGNCRLIRLSEIPTLADENTKELLLDIYVTKKTSSNNSKDIRLAVLARDANGKVVFGDQITDEDLKKLTSNYVKYSKGSGTKKTKLPYGYQIKLKGQDMFAKCINICFDEDNMVTSYQYVDCSMTTRAMKRDSAGKCPPCTMLKAPVVSSAMNSN